MESVARPQDPARRASIACPPSQRTLLSARSARRASAAPRPRAPTPAKISELFPPDGGNSEQVLAEFAENGIDVAALATRLQDEGKESFNKSWKEMLETIGAQSGVAAGY